MDRLKTTLTLNKATILSPNLTDQFDNEDLDKIGAFVLDNFNRDLESRKVWLRRTEAAMDLALQVVKEKSVPWPDCANIAFPLVTIAALQFHARAYPTLINGRDLVRMKVSASDTQGITRQRAELISQHMSWQLLEQDEAWEEDADRGALNVAIVGCGFKKSYYNSGKGHNVSEFVTAKDLVINYWARSVDSAPVKTHVIPMYKNDIYERCARGSFRDVREESWFISDIPVAPEADGRKEHRQGTSAGSSDPNAPFEILEQHLDLDLDDDGYAEPYVITIERASGKVLRIAVRCNRWEDVELDNAGRVVSIRAHEYFTKIPFIPSPDGGIYDIGFGVLLGPLNESVNSALNQLFDAGTLSNTAGGFLGRGAKIRGGRFQFRPFDWQRVDATGDDLRKSIFPLPVREPSTVMLQLLSLIIDFTSRVSGTTDMMVGKSPGQNTPAETSRAMLQQGQAVYSAIFKRMWRSMKQEFKKLFILNAFYLPATQSFGEGQQIRREDYMLGSTYIRPAADPTLSSSMEVFAQAQLTREAALSGVHGYDQAYVERLYLKALGVDEVDKIFPGPDKVAAPAPDIKLQIQEMKNQNDQLKLQSAQQMFIIKMQGDIRLNDAKILQMTAHAKLLEAQATNEPQKIAVESFRAAIEAIREHNKNQQADLDRMMESLNGSNPGTSGAVPSLEGPPSNPMSLPQTI